jgi:hypothetical protein
VVQKAVAHYSMVLSLLCPRQVMARVKLELPNPKCHLSLLTGDCAMLVG